MQLTRKERKRRKRNRPKPDTKVSNISIEKLARAFAKVMDKQERNKNANAKFIDHEGRTACFTYGGSKMAVYCETCFYSENFPCAKEIQGVLDINGNFTAY